MTWINHFRYVAQHVRDKLQLWVALKDVEPRTPAARAKFRAGRETDDELRRRVRQAMPDLTPWELEEAVIGVRAREIHESTARQHAREYMQKANEMPSPARHQQFVDLARECMERVGLTMDDLDA